MSYGKQYNKVSLFQITLSATLVRLTEFLPLKVSKISRFNISQDGARHLKLNTIIG